MATLRRWLDKAPRLKKLIKSAIHPWRMAHLAVRSRLQEMESQSRCRDALRDLGNEVAAMNASGAGPEISIAFRKAEASLRAAYEQSPRISINRIRNLRGLRKKLRSDARLAKYAADRYLGIHSPDFRPQTLISASERRLTNDLLSLLVAAAVPVTPEVHASVLHAVALVRDRLSKIPLPAHYEISNRWKAISRLAMEVASGLEDPRLIAYTSMTMFDVGMPILDEAAAEKIHNSRKENYLRQFPELERIGESSIMLPGTTTAIGGVQYSEKMDQVFAYYKHIFSGVPRTESLRVVVEVGAGYGRLARVMRLAGKASCYVLVDLAESLLFAYAFLRVSFPDAKTCFVASREDIRPDMTRTFDFIFCPIQQLHHLALDDVDLLVNTYSFAEMPQPCVDHILDCIHEKIRPRFFFSLNAIFTDKTIHFDTGGIDNESNEIVLKMRPQWRPRSIELLPRVIGGKWRIDASVVLERASGVSSSDLVAEMLAAADADSESPMSLVCLYLASLWSGDGSIADRFFKSLRRLHIATEGFADRPEYSFEDVGEVKFLRRLVGANAT